MERNFRNYTKRKSKANIIEQIQQTIKLKIISFQIDNLTEYFQIPKGNECL